MLWPTPAAEQVMDGSPLLRAQQFVATDAHDQATLVRRLEQRHDGVSVGWEQQTISKQVPARVRSDQVELAVNWNANPVGDLKMIEDQLLPRVLVGFREGLGV